MYIDDDVALLSHLGTSDVCDLVYKSVGERNYVFIMLTKNIMWDLYVVPSWLPHLWAYPLDLSIAWTLG